MSKRFGRNQRRKLRDEKNDLNFMLLATNSLLKKVREDKANLQDQIAAAKKYLGEMTGLFAPASMSYSFNPPSSGVLKLPKIKNFSSFAYLESAPIDVAVETLDLALMKAGAGTLRDQVHAYAEFNGGQWRYLMSNAYLQNVPEDILIDRIAKYMAQVIARDLKSKVPA